MKKEGIEKQILTPEGAAKLLGMTRFLVLQLMKDGVLPFWKTATGRYRIKLCDVLSLKK